MNKLREASFKNEKDSFHSHGSAAADDGIRLMLEIGTGMGNFFSNYAENHPDTSCV